MKLRPGIRSAKRSRSLLKSNRLVRYIYKLLNISGQGLLLFLLTNIFFIIILYLCKMMWFTYTATSIGKNYIEMSPVISNGIEGTLSGNLMGMSIEITWSSFKMCILTGFVCQFFHLSRFLYQPLSNIGKTMLWGSLLTIITGYNIQNTYQFGYWIIPYFIVLVPVLCLFANCFRFAYELIPELGDIMKGTSCVSEDLIFTKAPMLVKIIEKCATGSKQKKETKDQNEQFETTE